MYYKNVEFSFEFKGERQVFDLKFGIDEGGGSLIACLPVQCATNNNDSLGIKKARQNYKEEISGKKFKNSSAIKLLLLLFTKKWWKCISITVRVKNQ